MAEPQQQTPSFTDDDAIIKAALEEAHIPTLMNCLVHLTGDAQIIRGEIRPVLEFFGDAQGGISEAQQAGIRARAFEILTAYRDGDGQLPPDPSSVQVSEMVNFLIGQEVSAEYGDFLTAELALHGEDAYAQPGFETLSDDAKAAFKVVIIGAGMSGLLSAVRLQEAGIPFTILEKHADVGGTWHQNIYPGCRVDSANHMYSYSFKPRDWPQHYSRQAVLKDYFAETADEYNLRPHIRFETEVTDLIWSDDEGTWTIKVTSADGAAQTLTANAVISAVGQLNRPKWPDIPGQERYAGPSFHSTYWEYEHDLKGKTVGVVGTGASAFQFVPEIAQEAKEVRVFQRTAPWMAPVEDYMQDIPKGKHWLLNNVPYYHAWFKFAVFWRNAEGILSAVTRDPAWNGDEQRSIGPENEMVRELFLENIRSIVGHDPELFKKCIPDYPPGGKRILFDDGTWLRALARDNVQLFTDPIVEINETGLATGDGTQHDVDVLVYATGFEASRFLWPMNVVGRKGKVLEQHWDGDARAYLGITIPHFPNLFCCYGPNTNIVVNGSIIFFSECEVRYALGCIKLLLERGERGMDCKEDVHDAYNTWVDAGNAEMAWGISHANTWYRNEKGRISQNWPYSLLEFWRQTKAPDAADYHFV
ncbi:MAG: NAD(P)/FAD-dependent oxidoreductase [Gammaproteobacteria bacterium]|nr:MAG: NAD(P)/FAD-dependent oxidoreductase [Gammaproteobacteria bacterium]TDJ42653.1 MAG: NAD(P)/FAD-dependent oxidoreductase [Gammaproteobacteria bacterium]